MNVRGKPQMRMEEISPQMIASISESVASAVEDKLKEQEERLDARLTQIVKDGNINVATSLSQLQDGAAVANRLSTAAVAKRLSHPAVIQSLDESTLFEMDQAEDIMDDYVTFLSHEELSLFSRLENSYEDGPAGDVQEGSANSFHRSISTATPDFMMSDTQGQFEKEGPDRTMSDTRSNCENRASHVRISTSERTMGSTSNPNRNSASTSTRKDMLQRLDEAVNQRNHILHSMGPVQKKFVGLVNHNAFDALFGILIFVNALVVGFEVEYKATISATHEYFLIISYIFLVVFSIELSCRLVAGGRFLFQMPDWKWIIFDFFMVVVSLADVVTFHVHSSNDNLNSLLKTIRILRLFRIARVLRFIPPLRIIIFSIIACLRDLFWLVILLLIVLYVFSLCFTMAATEHVDNRDFEKMSTKDAEACLEIDSFYGTVARSLYSCLRAILDGQSWGELLAPLITVHPFYGCVFILYIVFSILALLNIVTGVFVNGALEKSENEREMVAEKEVSRRKACVEHLQQIFMESDEDHTGEVTLEAFNKHMRDPTVEPYIAAMNIDTSNMTDLFSVLDKDDSGSINLHEFVDTLLELMFHGHDNEMHKLVAGQLKLSAHFAKFAAFMSHEIHAIHKVQRSQSLSESRHTTSRRTTSRSDRVRTDADKARLLKL